MKPRLIHNWPAVKCEHDEISQVIKNVIYEYSADKSKGEGRDANDVHKKLDDDLLNSAKSHHRIPSRDEVQHVSNFYSIEKPVK